MTRRLPRTAATLLTILLMAAPGASAGTIGTAVHRTRRLAQWELGRAGTSVSRHGRLAEQADLAVPASASTPPPPWLLHPGQPWLLIFRGWPVTWDVVRAPGEVRIRCWGGKHTRVRGDLTSTLTLKNLRTGELVFADCDAIGEGNWRYSIHALTAFRSDAIEVWKSPTVAVRPWERF